MTTTDPHGNTNVTELTAKILPFVKLKTVSPDSFVHQGHRFCPAVTDYKLLYFKIWSFCSSNASVSTAASSSAEHLHTSLFSAPPSRPSSPPLHHLTGTARAWDDEASGLKTWAFQRGPGGIKDNPLCSRGRRKTLGWRVAALRNVMPTRGMRDDQAPLRLSGLMMELVPHRGGTPGFKYGQNLYAQHRLTTEAFIISHSDLDL